MERVPPLIVVVPVYAFVPERVRIPAFCLIILPPVPPPRPPSWITPAKVVELLFPNVSVLAPKLTTVVLDALLKLPMVVALVTWLTSKTEVPEIDTLPAVASDPFPERAMVPPLIAVVPVYVFIAERVRTLPLPCRVMLPPVPPPSPPSWITPAQVEDIGCPTLPKSKFLEPKLTSPVPFELKGPMIIPPKLIELMSKVPVLFTTTLPVVIIGAPLPMREIVPPLIVVVPVYVLLPDRVKTPPPCLVIAPPVPPPSPPSWIVPAKTLEAGLPRDNVLEPKLTAAPDVELLKALMVAPDVVWLISKVAFPIETVADTEILPLAPLRAIVPALIVVAPV
jgi:hypothetical protein